MKEIKRKYRYSDKEIHDKLELPSRQRIVSVTHAFRSTFVTTKERGD